MNPIELSQKEVAELFRILKPQERNLPTTVLVLLNRMEKHLYGSLTIDEMERLLPAVGPR
jgi:hypothetical protein